MGRRVEIVPNLFAMPMSISMSWLKNPFDVLEASTEFDLFERMIQIQKEQEEQEIKMMKVEKAISRNKKIVELFQEIKKKKKKMNADILRIKVLVGLFQGREIEDILEGVLIERKSGRERLLMTFLAMLILISHFLSMFISSRCKKNILLWTDKAVLLVLWTCGDVELNPGPNETNPAKARSQILREFRRSSQTMLLKMMYKTCNRIFPSKPYDVAPPGWKENKPDIEFKNISNLRSGDDKVFSKMIWLLRNWSRVPLSSEWDVLLRHYDNLNTKLEQEDSKKALERWMHEKKLISLLQGYSENVDNPSVKIRDLCLAIWQKVPNMDQPDVLDFKKFDDKDLKTDPNGYAGFRQRDEEPENAELHPLELFNDKERPESDTNISADARSLNQHCDENQSVEVPHRVQRKRRRRTEESTLAAGTKIIKRGEKDLVQSQEMLDKNFPFIIENHDNDTQNTTEDQFMQTCLENVDLTMLPCNKHFVESDCDCAKQISSSKDNFWEIEDLETLLSDNLPGEENHANDTCGELLRNSDMSLSFNNIDIYDDELNELDGDQAEMSSVKVVDLYILIINLEKYLKYLGNDRPSSRIVELCQDILNKEHACNTDTN